MSKVSKDPEDRGGLVGFISLIVLVVSFPLMMMFMAPDYSTRLFAPTKDSLLQKIQRIQHSPAQNVDVGELHLYFDSDGSAVYWVDVTYDVPKKGPLE